MTSITECLDSLDTKNAIWIGGDFNLPDINWTNETVVGHQYPIAINNAFIDKTRDLGLMQINKTPTRCNNILDLFLTNRPSLVTKCVTIPGVSDHDILITDSTSKSEKNAKHPHQLTIWKPRTSPAYRKK